MREVAQDVHQLGGFPPHAINIYLIGDVLIDAGTRMSRRRIVRELGRRRLSGHALTHAHPDHQGSSHAICTASAWVCRAARGTPRRSKTRV